MIKQTTLFAMLCMLVLIAAGCAPATPAGPDTAAVASAVAGTLTAAPPATQAPATPAVVSLVTATPLPPGAPAAEQTPAGMPQTGGVLPAPLYYLSDASGSLQVWRMEMDGATVRPVTNEPAPVNHFDISPVDGRLAFVSGNDLYLAAPDGSGRSLLVDGPPMPAEDHPQVTNLLLGNPRWSPDGSTIAYGLGGVNLAPTGGGAPRLVLASDRAPEPPDYASQGPVYFYSPNRWAPDSKRLLVDYGIWPEAGGAAVLLPDGSGQPPLVLLNNPESIVCCQPIWSVDGQSIYYANPYFGMFSAGLWQADSNSGSSTTLIKGDAGGSLIQMPGFVHQGRDGKLYYFFASASEFPTGDVLLSLHRSEPDGFSGRTQLRSDAYLLNEALWSHDDRGVVIVDRTNVQPGAYSYQGPLIWLDVLGGPAVPLQVSGYSLRWGK